MRFNLWFDMNRWSSCVMEITRFKPISVKKNNTYTKNKNNIFFFLEHN